MKMGDSNFQFFAELTVPPQVAVAIGTLNCLCLFPDIILVF